MLAVPERKEKLYLHRAVYLRRTAPRIVYPCVESGGGSRKLAEGELPLPVHRRVWSQPVNTGYDS